VAPLSPERYRVQFTIDAETRDQLARLQALLRREIPDGDPGLIFKRAIGVLLDKVERRKLGKADRPRPAKATRFETDEDAAEGTLPPRATSRAVRRRVWQRDGGRCAYVSPDGRRCSGPVFLEFHHQRPYVLRGDGSQDNIALRCRRHNQYEAELVFGGASHRVKDTNAPPSGP
jgi:hypothetical protein